MIMTIPILGVKGMGVVGDSGGGGLSWAYDRRLLDDNDDNDDNNNNNNNKNNNDNDDNDDNDNNNGNDDDDDDDDDDGNSNDSTNHTDAYSSPPFAWYHVEGDWY